MTKHVLVLTCATLLLATGCGKKGGDDDDSTSPTPTPTATPTPGVTHEYAINGTGWGPHNNEIVGVRVLDMQGNVLACGNDQTVGGGQWTYTFADSIPDGADVAVEIWGGTDANATYDTGDHIWVLTYTGVTADVDEADYPHDAGSQASEGATVGTDFTWTSGTGCT